MEPKEVLNLFLELCDKRTGYLPNHLFSNAVLEWFGKTIRNKFRINNYYRHQVSLEYEHNFRNAEQCEPFETKESHFRTKEISSEDINSYKNSLKKSEPISFMEFKTPEQSEKIPVLPQLTQGRLFRSMTDDFIDEDLSELGLSGIEEAVTPPKTTKPLEKRMKMNDKSTKTNQDDVGGCSSTTVNEDEDDKLKSNDIATNDSNYLVIEDSSESNSSTNDELQLKDNIYSNLMYIEAIGMLRMINQEKHLKSTTPGSKSPWDRKTRLKISYRINKIDNDIQFALIIYEHVNCNPIVKRNLLQDFEKVEDIDDDEITLKLKRKTPIKRVLRL